MRIDFYVDNSIMKSIRTITRLAWQQLLTSCVVCLCLLGSAHAERRALIIGIGAYQNIPALKSPVKDANDMAKALIQSGFPAQNVMLRTDLDLPEMQRTIRNFKNTVKAGDDVVIYYTGHGMQIGGNNYLLPKNFSRKVNSNDEVVDESVRLQRLMADMQEQQARFTLLIVDACRDNPVQYAKSVSAGAGMAPERPSTGQMIVFATGDQQIARDGQSNTNSLFTEVLLQHLDKGQEIRSMMHRVKDQVHSKAKGLGFTQTPAVYDQSVGDFYLTKSVTTPRKAYISKGPVTWWSDGTIEVTPTRHFEVGRMMLKACEEGTLFKDGKCLGTVELATLGQARIAVNQANAERYAGYDDWTLPTYMDLLAIYADLEDTESKKVHPFGISESSAKDLYPTGVSGLNTWMLPRYKVWTSTSSGDIGGGINYKEDGRYPLRLIRFKK